MHALLLVGGRGVAVAPPSSCLPSYYGVEYSERLSVRMTVNILLTMPSPSISYKSFYAAKSSF